MNQNLLNNISIVQPRNPVGYWVLGDGFRIAMYSKPLQYHIINTEQLLGWKWEDESI